MADDLDTNVTEELETAIPETETTSDPETPELEAGSEPEYDADGNEVERQPEEEHIELDRNGKKLRVPKELESELLMHADYTKKTQALAAEKAALDADRVKLLQMDENEMQARVAIKAIDDRLKAYANIDWAAARAENWTAAQEAYQDYQMLKDKRGEAAGFLEQREQSRGVEAQRDFAKRKDDTVDWATKNIKGWNPALDKQITQSAVELGMSPEYLARNLNPLLYKFMHHAHVGYQAGKRIAAPKAPTPPPEPVTTVKAKSSLPPVGLSDRLSSEEWVKRRNAQVRKAG